MEVPHALEKTLKNLLLRKFPSIEFHKPKRMNQAERVTMKVTRYTAIQIVEENVPDWDTEMKYLYRAASLLRRTIKKVKPWSFTGSLSDINEDHLPAHLYSFYRWLLQGPNTTLSNDDKSAHVSSSATHLAQTTVSMFVSDQQVSRKPTQVLRTNREMPQQVSTALAVHKATRSKKVINLLHGVGMSVQYNRVLSIESQITTSVLKRMLDNDGTFLPPNIVLGRFVFFAIDNIDFLEDTPHGKGTAWDCYGSVSETS